jgi:hypothetical protein
VAAGLDRPPVAGVERLDRVRAAQDLADLQVIVQERDELLPGVVPEPDDRRIPLAPPLGQLVERSLRRRRVDGGIDRLKAALERIPVAPGGEPEGVADQVKL